MNNMRITFFASHLKVSGGERVILTYANLLARRGHEVRVVVRSRHAWRRHIANLLCLPPRWIRDFKARIVRVAHFEEHAIPDGDIIVASPLYSVFLVQSYSRKKGIKFHLSQHDERLYHGTKEEADRAYRLPLKKIVVSTWLKEVFKKEYGQDAELLLNTIDRNLFSPVKAKRTDSSIRILLLHHEYAWKGTKEGVEVVGKLKERFPEVKLVLFGAREKHIDFPYDEYYHNLPQEKLAWLYSGSDIFLCPSWDEGFGLPSLEAMACKCAVVTYDNGGSRDFAFDGETALVARRRDINDLLQKLEMLVRDAVLRKKIAENGFQFVRQMPTWEEQAIKMETIFKQALQSNG
ncbi:glycosyltransferase family 4 protein [Candidatus Azambacteria bacterium]|nr:glycosyltransferase family 4 protein [Candidatus Azambacteria bacterium]